MEVDRPGPGEEINAGEPTTPRPAASVILIRGGDNELEVLLLERNPQARFMGGAWVFPGGAVDRDEADDEDAFRRCAAREMEEEAGVSLPEGTEMIQFSRWITPAMVKTRFDTHFFIAELPDGQVAEPDGAEMVAARWLAPAAALDAYRAGEILLVFPTIKHLEQLAAFASARALVEHARGREVVAVEPRVVVSGETARILLPGEPGYD